MTTFHISAAGVLLRATSDPDAVIPDAIITTEIEPETGLQIWDFDTGNWGPVPPPPDPATTPLTLEDTERVLLGVPGVTRAKINQAKADRGKPLP